MSIIVNAKYLNKLTNEMIIITAADCSSISPAEWIVTYKLIQIGISIFDEDYIIPFRDFKVLYELIKEEN